VAAALGIAIPTAALTPSEAEAATIGMVRRRQRRENRRERREERRENRRERRRERRGY
jgi:hypothetical protein